MVANNDKFIMAGRLRVDKNYIGGKFEVFEDYEMDELVFGKLEICVKRFGYHSILKCALRDPNETDKYHFFMMRIVYLILSIRVDTFRLHVRKCIFSVILQI